jgi:uridine phosphorylase
MTRRRFANSANPAFDCGTGVILLPFGRQSYLAAAVERYRGERLGLDETTDRLVYELHEEAEGLTLVYSGMGSPAAANALEMAAANGGRRVVLFGACGGVREDVAVGDLVVATGGVRGEGTSGYYAPAAFPAACDPLLTAELWRAVGGDGPRAHRGVVYTTDAGYRQGPEIYEECAGLVVGVECECAASAVVAARLGLELGTLLFVTDNVTRPGPEEHDYRGLADERVRSAFERGLATAVEVLAASV